MPARSDEHHALRSRRTSTATNALAYWFPLTVAGSFAVLDKVRGEPMGQLFLFLVTACLALALVNALST